MEGRPGRGSGVTRRKLGRARHIGEIQMRPTLISGHRNRRKGCRGNQSESGGPGEVGTKTLWRFLAWMMVRPVMDSVRWDERVN